MPRRRPPRRRGAARPGLRTEGAQIFVTYALLLPVLIGFAGLVTDVGYWFVAKRQAQSAADAAALAAAQELPDALKADTVARTYVDYNVAGSATTVTTPYGGSANKVEVRVRISRGAFFSDLFGVDDVAIAARAVAVREGSSAPWAIFAHEDSCKGEVFRWNGSNTVVNGGIRSNGAFDANGSGFTVTSASAGGPDSCKPKVSGKNISFGGKPDPDIDATLHDWPLWFEPSDFPCTYSAAEFKLNTHGQTIPPGVYCASKSFEANGNDQTGTITVLAPEIHINGTGHRFDPFMKNMLFFITPGDKEFQLNGNDAVWNGIIFHPNGRVKINGNDGTTLNGMVMAEQVTLNGNGFVINGQGDTSTGAQIALIE